MKVQKDRLASNVKMDDRLAGLLPEAVKILEYVNQHGRITTGEAEALTAIPRPTLKKRLSDLVKAGLLVRYGSGRGSWYTKP